MAAPAPTHLPSLSLVLVSAHSLCLPPTSVSEYWHCQRDPGLREGRAQLGPNTEALEGRWLIYFASQPCTQGAPCPASSRSGRHSRPGPLPSPPSVHPSMHPSTLYPSIQTFFTSQMHKHTHTFCVQFPYIHPSIHPLVHTIHPTVYQFTLISHHLHMYTQKFGV